MAGDRPANEIGRSATRGRPRLETRDVDDSLSGLLGETVVLADNVVAYGSPESCPACGSSDVMWGCAEEQTRTRDEIHPLVWHETEWMADSFVCRSCWAGWIEPDDPAPIKWVRPYWRVGA